MKKYVLLQVRSSSKRLPFKGLLKIKSLPSIILLYKRIVSKSYKTIILTSNNSSDDYLCKELQNYKINFYRGNLANVKKRFLDFTKNYKNEDIIIRLTGDNLFIDKYLINEVISQLIKNKKKYLYTNPLISKIPLGISVEAFILKTLRQFKKNSLLDKEHVTINFDRTKVNTVNFTNINAEWKHLSSTVDTISDFYKIKDVFKKIKNPLSAKWQFLCNKLLGFKDKKNQLNKSKIILKSIYTKNLNKNLLKEIANLKSEQWKFKVNSQIKFIKKNFTSLDVHNLLYINKELAGYTALKRSNFYNNVSNIKKNCLIFDTFIIKKKFQNKNLSEILMCFNKNKIINLNLPTFLTCKNKYEKFYLKNNWKASSKKITIHQKKYFNLKIFSFNFKENKILNKNKSKIIINF